MKTKYCFIRNPHHFSADDVIYCVMVGTSEHDQLLLTLLETYCKDCGIYFKKWSRDVDTTLDNLQKIILPGSLFNRWFLKRAQLSINDIYQMILDDTFLSFESQLEIPRQQIHLLSMLSPKFYIKSTMRRKKVPAFSVKRQNLSTAGDSHLSSSLIGFGFILLLFLIAGYLEGLSMCYGW